VSRSCLPRFLSYYSQPCRLRAVEYLDFGRNMLAHCASGCRSCSLDPKLTKDSQKPNAGESCKQNKSNARCKGATRRREEQAHATRVTGSGKRRRKGDTVTCSRRAKRSRGCPESFREAGHVSTQSARPLPSLPRGKLQWWNVSHLACDANLAIICLARFDLRMRGLRVFAGPSASRFG
jgi:hypothetical protein